ncbi:MAG: hypothetical protein ACLUUO_10210 [Sellimonas intestinalis]
MQVQDPQTDSSPEPDRQQNIPEVSDEPKQPENDARSGKEGVRGSSGKEGAIPVFLWVVPVSAFVMDVRAVLRLWQTVEKDPHVSHKGGKVSAYVPDSLWDAGI